jgi:hypothetical protein
LGIYYIFSLLQNFKVVEVNKPRFLWVANAPIYGFGSNNAIENFVDKYISCDNNNKAPNLREVQTHCHKKTCRKKNQAIC